VDLAQLYAPLDGLEPPTQRLGRARSIHLSYRGVPQHSMHWSRLLARRRAYRYNSEASFGAWLSLVERTVRDREVGGSNPLAPTNWWLA
jgi:hypothetical protein